MVGLRPVLFADQGHIDGFPFVRRRGHGRAIKGLHALGVGDRGGEPTGDIAGDVAAADRHAVGVHQLAVVEYREGGGATAHVDDGGAEIHFVLDQAGQPGGERRDH